MQDDAKSAAGAQVRFWPLAAKTVISHTLTYFAMGALAFHFLHYAELINAPGSGMRPVSHPLVLALSMKSPPSSMSSSST